MSEKILPPRLELFSDAVFAIIITIMVLELHPPEGDQFIDLYPLIPAFLSYALSFVSLIIYWNNHHQLLKTMTNPTGKIMWMNSLLLFCLSLMPFATAWMGRHPGETIPTFIFGCVLLASAGAFTLLEFAIIATEGNKSVLAEAVGNNYKGKISLIAYALAVLVVFISPWITYLIFAGVALLWILPDQRIEKQLKKSTSA